MRLPHPDRLLLAWPLGTLLAALAFMRFVPGPEPGTVLFLAAAAWLTVNAMRGLPAASALAQLAAGSRTNALWLLLAVALAALLGIAAGHPPIAIAKSAVPFFVLVWAIFVVVPQVGCLLMLERLLIAAGSVWALRLIVAGTLDFLDGSSFKWLRLTLVDADAVIPFPLIVVPLALFSSRPHPLVWRALALALQLAVVVWSGYRSQQLLVAAMLLIALGRLGLHRPTAFAAVALVTAIAVSIGTAAIANAEGTSFLVAQVERYTSLQDEGEVSGRALERRFALDRFTDYPLLGAGLGLQVPASITYATTEISEDYDLPDTVSYLHNATFYMLMCGGLPFLLTYVALWLGGLRHCGNLWVRVALFSLFAFIHVEATFLQVHFNVLLALLVGLRFAPGQLQHCQPVPSMISGLHLPAQSKDS